MTSEKTQTLTKAETGSAPFRVLVVEDIQLYARAIADELGRHGIAW